MFCFIGTFHTLCLVFFLMIRRPPRSTRTDTLFPYTTLFRSQHLLQTVRVSRRKQFDKSPTADAGAYLANWWLLGKPRPELRPAIADLSRYIATVDTAAHRLFQFLSSDVVCDDKVVITASDDGAELGVLRSEEHTSELQSLMRISYAVFCLKKKKQKTYQ